MVLHVPQSNLFLLALHSFLPFLLFGTNSWWPAAKKAFTMRTSLRPIFRRVRIGANAGLAAHRAKSRSFLSPPLLLPPPQIRATHRVDLVEADTFIIAQQHLSRDEWMWVRPSTRVTVVANNCHHCHWLHQSTCPFQLRQGHHLLELPPRRSWMGIASRPPHVVSSHLLPQNYRLVHKSRLVCRPIKWGRLRASRNASKLKNRAAKKMTIWFLQV